VFDVPELEVSPMRVSTAFSRLLCLPGVWVRSVSFEPDRVIVTVSLRARLLRCPKYSYSTRHRESQQHHDSVWRHLDLGRWRLEVHARLRRLRCPEHGVLVEGVPFARDGAGFARDFENLIAWLATKTDRTATCRLTRIDWQTTGRVIERVGCELIDGDRLTGLFEISIDEVAWRKGTATSRWSVITGAAAWSGAVRARDRPPPMSSSESSTPSRAGLLFPSHNRRKAWRSKPTPRIRSASAPRS
jgi:hypothetical protein